MKYHINRSKNLCDYLDKQGWSKALNNEISDFSMWDTYKHKPISSKIKVWEKEDSYKVDHLYYFHKGLEELKHTNLAPYTITDWKNPDKKLCEKDFSYKDFWFLKKSTLCHGKGINVLSSYDDYIKYLEDDKYTECDFVLQKCIYDSHLIDNRKYIIRIYILTINKQNYLYHDGLYYTALFPIDKDFKDIYITDNNKIVDSNDKHRLIPKKQMRINTHITHWKADTELKPYGILDLRIKGILSDLPEYKQIIKNIYKNASGLNKLFQKVYDESVSNNSLKYYHIWGLDYLVLPNLDVKCIEINGYPCLTHGFRGCGEKERPFEYKFRNSGFDRDLMRRLGYDFENKKNSYNSWIELKNKKINKSKKNKRKKNRTMKK